MAKRKEGTDFYILPGTGFANADPTDKLRREVLA